MLHIKMTARFKDVAKTHQIGIDVGPWVLNGISNASLSGQIDHPLWAIFFKEPLKTRLIFQCQSHIRETGSGG